ncbi:MAG: prenyltransferase/squalene oxidase repeat-containing protein [Candidatus Saccharibacteria bacterium]|nr:prenyltransferase/squalene oxidase repeat-containing protein [Candidatus Saccharibacteria bacterium]
MKSFLGELKYDPIQSLLSSGSEQVAYFTDRDLLDKSVEPIETLWDLKIPSQILRKQQADGSWKYPGKNKPWHTTDYDQLETYRQLGFLVQMFGFNKSHPALAKTAEYFFSKQSKAGDFRGIYAAQYSPNYTAAIAELLILAGYDNDQRIKKVFNWLLSIRQDDGGWALPLRTQGHNLEAIFDINTIEPDKSKPFSHLITGIVLRAFAAHPEYMHSREAKVSGELLASRFFQKDSYTDLKSPTAWQTFSYPFWNTDLISSLHILTKLGFSIDDKRLQNAAGWLRDKQTPNGLFDIHKNHDRYHDQDLWLTLAICRTLKIL